MSGDPPSEHPAEAGRAPAEPDGKSDGDPGAALAARSAVPVAVVSGALTVGVVAAGYAALQSMSFFGESSQEQYTVWTVRPVLAAGLVVTALALVALLVVVLTRASWNGPSRTVLVTATALTCLAVLLVGGVIDGHRHHPEPFERRALTTLAVPAGSRADSLTVGSSPTVGTVRAGPPGQGPPVGVRSWISPNSARACAQMLSDLHSWADAGSVRRPLADGAPGMCEWFATYHHWQVLAEVVGPPTPAAPTSLVLIDPPGVLF